MRTALRTRYYCDFCKKSGGSKPAMAKHETSCTNNPDRVCRMCKFADLEQKPIGELTTTYAQQGWKALRELAGGCPVCILAGERQAHSLGGAMESRPDSENWRHWFELDDRGDWEFKKAATDFLEAHRPQRYYE